MNNNNEEYDEYKEEFLLQIDAYSMQTNIRLPSKYDTYNIENVNDCEIIKK